MLWCKTDQGRIQHILRGQALRQADDAVPDSLRVQGHAYDLLCHG